MDEFTQLEERKQELHIEALRAASRIVAGAFASGKSNMIKTGETGIVTFDLAEQFARWLEKGER